MMNLRNALTTTTAAIALCAAASAQAGDYYLTVFGGLSTFDDEVPFNTSQTAGFTLFKTVTVLGSFHGYIGKYTYLDLGITAFTGRTLYGTSKFAWEDDFDSGFVVGAALGTDLGNGFRGELEVAYRAADVDGGGSVVNDRDGRYILFGYISKYSTVKVLGSTVFSTAYTVAFTLPPTVSGQPFPFYYNLPTNTTITGTFSSDGDVSVWSLMANVWLDIDVFGLNPDGVTTFFGGGIGVAQLDFEYNASMGTFLGGTLSYSLDDSGMGFAYQLGAGIGFEMGDGMMLSAQYRWFGTSDIDVGGTDMRVESHNLLLSLSVPIGNLIP